MDFIFQVIFWSLIFLIIYRAIHNNTEENKRLNYVVRNLGKDKGDKDYVFVEDNGEGEEEDSEGILIADSEEEQEEVVLW